MVPEKDDIAPSIQIQDALRKGMSTRPLLNPELFVEIRRRVSVNVLFLGVGTRRILVPHDGKRPRGAGVGGRHYLARDFRAARPKRTWLGDFSAMDGLMTAFAGLFEPLALRRALAPRQGGYFPASRRP